MKLKSQNTKHVSKVQNHSMMRSLMFLFIIGGFMSCSKNDDSTDQPTEPNFTCIETIDDSVFTNDCRESWECKYRISASSRVDISQPLGISEGDNLVFQLDHYTEGEIMIADDEIGYILVFEIHPNQKEISLVDEDLNTINIHLKTICFCPEVGFLSPLSGCLEGSRLSDGNWAIQADIIFSEAHIKFDAKF